MQTIDWPFRAAEALDAGALTFRELRRFHAAVYPGVWAPREVELSADQRARAAWLWSGRKGVLAGLSASAMLGAKWIEPATPAELVHTNRRPPPLIIVHTDALLSDEIQAVSGMPATTPVRTAFDLGRRLGRKEAVQRIDALMNATNVKVKDIEAVIGRHRGVRGLRQLCKTLELVDGGAESPYESLTRLLLVQAGFPRPQTQIPVYDEYGFVVARIDMGWPQWRVGVDFEGAHHWTDPRQRDWDVERYAKLSELGWTDVRLTAGTLHHNPRLFLNRVGAALIGRGCPKTWKDR
ncbi:hypothetical protein H7K24_19705 [Mycobacterium fragae]|jgi:hypothetical protein|uniref:DUF559 domain-containing protein n=1 Tax=Mycobacterium fragae TaxID=1260918 RepID=A0A1X1USW5_9MYCO|nr:hypothetical protein [Mycobacterium fragae]MCV7402368.1 hypothetical protein [Mycobacterium fragae]ORV59739.1 hypothetical protein AWC06_16645 [Mycobacterium fragae]